MRSDDATGTVLIFARPLTTGITETGTALARRRGRIDMRARSRPPATTSRPDSAVSPAPAAPLPLLAWAQGRRGGSTSVFRPPQQPRRLDRRRGASRATAPITRAAVPTIAARFRTPNVGIGTASEFSLLHMYGALGYAYPQKPPSCLHRPSYALQSWTT